jgi:hypothetical protein
VWSDLPCLQGCVFRFYQDFAWAGDTGKHRSAFGAGNR